MREPRSFLRHEDLHKIQRNVVDVLAPVESSLLAEFERFRGLPYLVHPSPLQENEGRLTKLPVVRTWRGRRLEALAQATWHKRLNALLTKLPNVEVVDWRNYAHNMA
jgi:hypothetical protein